MQLRPHEALDTRRVILLRHSEGGYPEVLLGCEATGHSLPQVQVARCQRVAEQLATAFKQTYSMDAISVSSLEPRAGESNAEHIAYEVMEPHGTYEEASQGKRWIRVSSLAEGGFHERNDFQAVLRAVAQSITSAGDLSDKPFARLGCFHKLEQWVQEQIRPRGLHLQGRYRQLNASLTFSLIRFETDGPAVWFKAVGAPSEHEYTLTLALASSLPRFLPQVIATHPECNGWLSLEAEGTPLHESSQIASWEMVARDLARLQIQSLDTCVNLLGLGARDLRNSALADLVEPFFRAIGELMECQPKTPPLKLSREELGILAERVQEALGALEDTGVPDTVGHMDLNPGNIICSPGGSVFLDWAETFVGHPLLTFEYLLEHFRRTFDQRNPGGATLLSSYMFAWRDFFCADHLHRLQEIIPLLAVFAYATRSVSWRDPHKLKDPQMGYLRSLARRMDREAHRLVEGSPS